MAQGFVDMATRTRAAAADFAPAARDRILATGQVCLAFAIGEPALLRVMFGQKPGLSDKDIVTVQGKACFACVLEEVVSYCTVRGVLGDAPLIAMQLWTLVHGAASLANDGEHARVASDVDMLRMVEMAADRLLFSLPRTRPD